MVGVEGLRCHLQSLRSFRRSEANADKTGAKGNRITRGPAARDHCFAALFKSSRPGTKKGFLVGVEGLLRHLQSLRSFRRTRGPAARDHCFAALFKSSRPGTKKGFLVGVEGFEPPTLCSQSRCASQAALHPVTKRAVKIMTLKQTVNLLFASPSGS